MFQIHIGPVYWLYGVDLYGLVWGLVDPVQGIGDIEIATISNSIRRSVVVVMAALIVITEAVEMLRSQVQTLSKVKV